MNYLHSATHFPFARAWRESGLSRLRQVRALFPSVPISLVVSAMIARIGSDRQSGAGSQATRRPLKMTRAAWLPWMAWCAIGMMPTAGALTSQTITFGVQPTSTLLVPGGTLPINASASSGLPVSFGTTTPSICTASGNTLSLLIAGSCVVTANQAGNATYAAAPQVSITIALIASSPVWKAAANMPFQRARSTASLLGDGRVLVIGGEANAAGSPVPSTDAALYDPHTDTWTNAAAMGTARSKHAAVVLNDGSVLAIGGGTPTAERYRPATNAWTATPAMVEVRQWHTATVLADGRVLVAGGLGLDSMGAPSALGSSEIYDPATDAWSPVEI